MHLLTYLFTYVPVVPFQATAGVLDLTTSSGADRQWRRQVLLRGRAKLEIRSWGSRGGLRSRVQQRLDD